MACSIMCTLFFYRLNLNIACFKMYMYITISKSSKQFAGMKENTTKTCDNARIKVFFPKRGYMYEGMINDINKLPTISKFHKAKYEFKAEQQGHLKR